MITKLFEVRDRATLILVMAVKLEGGTDIEARLLARAGYNRDDLACAGYNRDEGIEPYIILTKLDGVEAHYDPFDWGGGRTMRTIHQYMIEHWDELVSGQVLDAEFIAGETSAPKASEIHP